MQKLCYTLNLYKKTDLVVKKLKMSYGKIVDEKDDVMNEAFKKKLHNNTQFSEQTQCCRPGDVDPENADRRMHR